MEHQNNFNESEVKICSSNETTQYYDNVKADNTIVATETSNE